MGRLFWPVFLLFLLLLSQINCSSSPSSAPLCHSDQSSALLQFKNSFLLSNPEEALQVLCEYNESGTYYLKTDSWQIGTDCCAWDGITCDKTTGHVIGIDVSCNLLQGVIHPNNSLFSLLHLERLNLAYNNFNFSTGPSKLGQFANMTHLNLSASDITGELPSEISYLSNLVSLDLSWNYPMRLEMLSFKRLIQNATKLSELFLTQVDMSFVSPSSFMNLSSSLTSLQLSLCGLNGRFPDNIFHLPNLQLLDLSDNENLSGSLPKFNWSSPIKSLDLSGTGFSIDLPNLVSNLKFLKELFLGGCNFIGSSPTLFPNLTQITSLSLSYNYFGGQFPWSILNFERLTHLDLSQNNFIGQIPDFSSPNNSSYSQQVSHLPSNLVSLFLSDNLLNGTLPSWLYVIPSLRILFLDNNQLTGHIGEFKYNSLEILHLSNNNLHGPLPISISKLVNLRELRISFNNLSGNVDPTIFLNLQSLESLSLSRNPLFSFNTHGIVNYTLPNLNFVYMSFCNLSEIPPFLSAAKYILRLSLSNIHLQGNIPTWFLEVGKDSLRYLNLSGNSLTSIEQFPWKYLKYLDLSSNLLQGQFPVPPLHIVFFSISKNNLSGEIPSFICNLTFVMYLDFSYNHLSDTIPPCLGNMSDYLTDLDLRDNNLHGTIPTFLKGSYLRNLNVNGNQLEGPLPRSLVNCKKLEVLDVGNNKLNDTFPYCLETLPELRVLVLRSNSFYGVISNPKTEFSFPNLRIIDLSHNKFHGLLPTNFFNNLKGMMNENTDEGGLKYMGDDYYQDSVKMELKGDYVDLVKILTLLTTIDFSSNRFKGEIPNAIGKLRSLKGLNFSHNNLMGHISPSLGNLTNLEWLDLSSNKLTGHIPLQLVDLTFLEILNLSENHLVGPIPLGNQFNTFTNDSYNGNLGLCGFPLTKTCGNDEGQPPPPSPTIQEDDFGFANGFHWKVVLLGYGCGFMFGLGMGYLVFASEKPKWLVNIVYGERRYQVRRSKQNAHRRIG